MARKISTKRFAETSKMLAKWPALEREQIVRNLMHDLPSKVAEEIADNAKRAAYHAEIRSLAEGFKAQIDAGEMTDRDDMIERLHETIDGHHDVIYTACAMDVVCQSDNSGAYAEEFGPDGMVEGGEIQWSRLAYAAMHRDVSEQLSAIGVDLNADFCATHHVPEVDGACPKCEEAADK